MAKLLEVKYPDFVESHGTILTPIYENSDALRMGEDEYVAFDGLMTGTAMRVRDFSEQKPFTLPDDVNLTAMNDFKVNGNWYNVDVRRPEFNGKRYDPYEIYNTNTFDDYPGPGGSVLKSGDGLRKELYDLQTMLLQQGLPPDVVKRSLIEQVLERARNSINPDSYYDIIDSEGNVDKGRNIGQLYSQTAAMNATLQTLLDEVQNTGKVLAPQLESLAKAMGKQGADGPRGTPTPKVVIPRPPAGPPPDFKGDGKSAQTARQLAPAFNAAAGNGFTETELTQQQQQLADEAQAQSAGAAADAPDTPGKPFEGGEGASGRGAVEDKLHLTKLGKPNKTYLKTITNWTTEGKGMDKFKQHLRAMFPPKTVGTRTAYVFTELSSVPLAIQTFLEKNGITGKDKKYDSYEQLYKVVEDAAHFTLQSTTQGEIPRTPPARGRQPDTSFEQGIKTPSRSKSTPAKRAKSKGKGKKKK